ncbi:uncharacterized protein LOC129735629 [Falco cherrug]|uniref:uncharacterized protein LOC129735629 n=1 Tax=Falco cherrug TaxID=345164 RepID=UPI002479873E|nr:uncharacterized protein LOC129735629 [Falco cherrug]
MAQPGGPCHGWNSLRGCVLLPPPPPSAASHRCEIQAATFHGAVCLVFPLHALGRLLRHRAAETPIPQPSGEGVPRRTLAKAERGPVPTPRQLARSRDSAREALAASAGSGDRVAAAPPARALILPCEQPVQTSRPRQEVGALCPSLTTCLASPSTALVATASCPHYGRSPTVPAHTAEGLPVTLLPPALQPSQLASSTKALMGTLPFWFCCGTRQACLTLGINLQRCGMAAATLGLLPPPPPPPAPQRARGNHPHSPAAAPTPGSWLGAGAGDRPLQRAGNRSSRRARAAPCTIGELMQCKEQQPDSSCTDLAPARCLRWDRPTLRNIKINQVTQMSHSWVPAATKPQPQTGHPLSCRNGSSIHEETSGALGTSDSSFAAL